MQLLQHSISIFSFGKLQKERATIRQKRKVKKQKSESTFRRCLKWKVLVFTRHITKVHTSSVPYIKVGGMSIFSPVALHTQMVNAFLLIQILKNIFLRSGLTDMTTSCFNWRLLHIALCDFSVAVAVVAR